MNRRRSNAQQSSSSFNISSVMSPQLKSSDCKEDKYVGGHELPTVYEADHDGRWRAKFTILDLALKLAEVWPDFAAGFSTDIDDIVNYPVQRKGLDKDMRWIECKSRPLAPYFTVSQDSNGSYHISFIYGNLGAVSATITGTGEVLRGPIS